MEDKRNRDSEFQKELNQRLSSTWQFLFGLQKNRYFNIIMDGIRILLLILMIVTIFILLKEIEAVKVLAFDPCRICVEKTGCQCVCMSDIREILP